jgi:anti-sigma regulatory factor (Ser/Thr protein kinase)
MNAIAERFVVPAHAEYLPKIRDFSAAYARKNGLSREEQNSIKLSVDEICSNIVLYAYKGVERGDIQIEFQRKDNCVMIRIVDSGVAFDYSTVKTPDLDQYIEEGRKGGLGLQLVRKLNDEFRYERVNDKNIITLYKKVGQAPESD